MPSAFSWLMLVPSALRAPAPVNLGVRLPLTLRLAIRKQMTISRNQQALALSAALLVAAMLLWPEMFLWAKVVHLPSWTEFLPAPIFSGSYVSFLCLLPAAFLTESFASAKRALIMVVALTPVAVVGTYLANPAHHNHYIVFNVVFHYIWVILFVLLLPSMLLLSMRKFLSYRRHHA